MVVGAVMVVTGLGGAGYMLAQFSAGGELAAHSFGNVVGAYVGAYEASRLQAKGEIASSVRTEAVANLAGAAERKNAVRESSGPDGAVRISRFKLNNALTNTIIHFHAGKKISRSAMEGEGVVDQRYWGLATKVLIELGLRNRNSSKYTTLGSEALDISYVMQRQKVLGQGEAIWVLRPGAAAWAPLEAESENETAGTSLPAGGRLVPATA